MMVNGRAVQIRKVKEKFWHIKTVGRSCMHDECPMSAHWLFTAIFLDTGNYIKPRLSEFNSNNPEIRNAVAVCCEEHAELYFKKCEALKRLGLGRTFIILDEAERWPIQHTKPRKKHG